MEIENENVQGLLNAAFVLLLFLLLFPGRDREGQMMKQRAQESASLYTEEKKVYGQAPRVALTFDDGPNAQYTPVLLDGLKERNVKATFFLIGNNIEEGENRELVKRMRKEGHVLGNHTYHHRELTALSEEEAYQELKATSDLIKTITGEAPEYMRPPFGAWQKELDRKAFMIPVLWSVDTLDWTTENTEEIIQRTEKEVQPEDIILLHDCYKSSVDAALRIVDLLQAREYEFVTVDDFIQP